MELCGIRGKCDSDYPGFHFVSSRLLADDVIEGTGGLRKIRYTDEKRGKGKRGGLRVIYYWWVSGQQFWLFTLYNKNEMNDLTPEQRKILKDLLKHELEARRHK